jgi:histidyl-tRNA synthetase
LSNVSKNALIEPRRLKGFRDYPPELMVVRRAVMDVVRRSAALAGFAEIATPALEYAQTLLGQGEETDKQVYRFKDHGDRDVAMRFDLTVPFARFVGENQGTLVFPFKKLQMGEVWRGENTQKGRYREFVQCDLDIIGVDSASADIEILGVFGRVLADVLGSYGAGAFTTAVGNRVVLSALIKRLLPGVGGAPEGGAGGETGVLIALDKLAKIGADKVKALLAAIPGASEAGAAALLQALMTKDAKGSTDLAKIKATLAGDEPALAEVERLERVVAVATNVLGKAAGRLVVDLTIARGLAYYTGIVFETTLDALPGFGSVCSGGRYNDLASRFSSRELPGVGGSIGLDRLVAALEEAGKVPAARATAKVMVAVATDDSVDYAFALATTLRESGVPTDVGLGQKLGNQVKYADRMGYAYVLTVGTSERDAKTYALKEMKTGETKADQPAAGVAASLKALLQ